MYPFHDSDTFTVFRNLINKITSEIKSLDNDYVLKSSPTELKQHFVDEILIEPLILHTDKLYILDQSGTDIDVSHDFRRASIPGRRLHVRGTRIDIAIPFEGDRNLWRIQASTFTTGGYPEIKIHENEIVFSVSFADDSVETTRVRADIDRAVKNLSDAVQCLKSDVDKHNGTAPEKIRQALIRKIELAKSAIGTVEALGILVKSAGSKPMFSIPFKPKKLAIKLPTVPHGEYKPEWYLDETVYQEILETMRSMSATITRNVYIAQSAMLDPLLLSVNSGVALRNSMKRLINY
jgi:hypothetical protein